MAEVYSFGELTVPVEKIALHSITSVLKGEVCIITKPQALSNEKQTKS